MEKNKIKIESIKDEDGNDAIVIDFGVSENEVTVDHIEEVLSRVTVEISEMAPEHPMKDAMDEFEKKLRNILQNRGSASSKNILSRVIDHKTSMGRTGRDLAQMEPENARDYMIAQSELIAKTIMKQLIESKSVLGSCIGSFTADDKEIPMVSIIALGDAAHEVIDLLSEMSKNMMTSKAEIRVMQSDDDSLTMRPMTKKEMEETMEILNEDPESSNAAQ